eukprot:TRINITY_DN20328_c0_g1_i1.p1 TRINITY_DN20328_c0_g1~~TRINITY_DN20328_c0_g1_i1.p1  ORF type:complete len:407 (+),score=153.24 TRINITY_DN20328_c0_g1_i1:151-1221(+)
MDSVISSLVYALYLNEVKGEPAVPVLNVAREDLPLRTETFYLLGKLGIATDSLTFYPEVADTLRAGSGAVILVDHCALIKAQDFLAPRVSEVVDHHADAGLYVEQCQQRGRLVRVVGSTCSLVALLLCGATHADLQQDAPPALQPIASAVSKEVATLLLGTTLIDTMNNNPEMKKSTPLDVTAAERMAELAFGSTDAAANVAEGTRLYDELVEKKYDTSLLTIPQSLRKDYKSFEMGEKQVGMASIVEGIDSLAAKGDLEAEMLRFVSSNGLHLLILMALTRTPEGSVERSLALLPRDEPLLEALQSPEEGSLGALLKLQPLGSPPYPKSIPVFKQGNVEISRKLLSPQLVKFFAK